MTAADGPSIAALRAWDATLNPLKTDLVCDFAGKELFAIHGESLLAHCVTEAKVDFADGFQLLHAVHAVEAFLCKLEQRGCNFHVLWFDSHEELSVPLGVPSKDRHKYLLTRAVLIEHLRHTGATYETSPDGSTKDANTKSPMSFLFSTTASDEFANYIKKNCLHFVMCSRGRPLDSNFNLDTSSIDHVVAMYRFANQGYSLAFIDDIEFRSSKVFARVVTSSRHVATIKLSEFVERHTSDLCAQFSSQLGWQASQQGNLQPSGDFAAREKITLIACASILKAKPGDATEKCVAAFLVHIAMLECGDLAQRSYESPGKGVPDEGDQFLESFSNIAIALIRSWTGTAANLQVWDLVDGRLFLHILQRIGSVKPVVDPRPNCKIIENLVGVDVSRHLRTCDHPVEKPARSESAITGRPKSQTKAAVLPFNHPVLNPYLEELKLETEQHSQDSAMHPKIFEEFTHWHNAKKTLNPKQNVRKPVEWWVLKRNQRFMADTIAYSASLTNASGKNINPETIVVQEVRKNGNDRAKTNATKSQEWKKELAQKAAAKGVKSSGKGGKRKGLEAAKTIQATKDEARSNAIINFFARQCQDYEKLVPLSKRYLKANKYLLGLSNADRDVIGGELSLYICKTLTTLLAEPPFEGRANSIIALLRSHVVDMYMLPLTTATRGQLQYLIEALQLPMPPSHSSPIIERPLPFKAGMHNTRKFLELPMDGAAREFQLEHCGPYMERSFDSAPDSRVPFQPDAWQRQVLDAIDENKSLFVVAPTSAGKTFISFYAMKKILQANNDDVIVYVAPTKALVNQIAAEIQARFSKSYQGGGRSVWAIHTRDYRINNPVGCQVLVTVPHILQIMLLAPSNAQQPDSWSHRVKRIIFDEVHCIGQAEDGIIWEQLLLLAPCPIIALSATVGNPLEFKDWLDGAQKAKGFSLDMVVHPTRYSDLRKFIYQPPLTWKYRGFKPVERLPIPGLDSEDGNTDRFVLVHSVGSIVNKSKETLNDISLEPRDCFQLWKTMAKYGDGSRNLDPNNALPKMIRKPDVIEWENALKHQLYGWMADPSSPFDNVRSDLQVSSSPCTHFEETVKSTLPLLVDLRSRGALPAIVFNYDRVGCEKILFSVLETLETAEQEYRDTNSEWKERLSSYERYKAQKAKTQAKAPKATGNRRGDKADGATFDKMDHLREDASQEAGTWASFDPEAPIDQFSFADSTKISAQELQALIASLSYANIKRPIINALQRGLGVHHAGMNRKYRQVVEMLFRKGFLTAVIATGTLALGLNMPCKTVVFAGDSVFLTALSYRQASGRAGRRGFDLLGNVVFHGIPHQRVMEIMSSRLPDLKGQFPMSVTLILRLFGLLHGTNRSDYAVKAIESLLTQTRLYLGGPSSQMAIRHHLRFSIEYLRRQDLLSANGVPLNYSGLVGHLYFAENAVFAFHSILKEGYFHRLCEGVYDTSKQKEILFQLLQVLCHLFCRIPCHRYMDKEWLQNIVHRSPSIVLLPRLPDEAERILRDHNKDTLDIFQTYVRTYVEQHLGDVPDNVLPFTKRRIGPRPNERVDFSGSNIPILPPTALRSPFCALSGFTDRFDTIHELCETVRAGVFLEEEAIPYIPIYPDETKGVPFNAYILDFFKHGDMGTLVRDNGIKGGDVWFHLKDFSLILATIVTSLGNFLFKSGTELDDMAMIDIQDVGDILEEGADAEQYDMDLSNADATSAPTAAPQKQTKVTKERRKKVLDSWEDDGDEEGGKFSETDGTAGNNSDTPAGRDNKDDRKDRKVYKAFQLLRWEFDEKFKKVWA